MVAKDELVTAFTPAGTGWRVANSKAALATLGRKLARLADTHRLATVAQPRLRMSGSPVRLMS